MIKFRNEVNKEFLIEVKEFKINRGILYYFIANRFPEILEVIHTYPLWRAREFVWCRAKGDKLVLYDEVAGTPGWSIIADGQDANDLLSFTRPDVYARVSRGREVC